ncbi:MAG: hypothetical protein HQM09_01295 [Candidatus Riflebacteria bacterium]|nr:hypothetical protein [Candidatus Riflebacteria bacterium]
MALVKNSSISRSLGTLTPAAIFTSLLLCAAFIFVSSASGAAKVAPGTMPDEGLLLRQIERCEKYLYSQTGDGALTERLTRIERDLLGRVSSSSPARKVENLSNFLFRGDSRSPSLDLKINYLEWNVFHETRVGPLVERLNALDKKLSGKPSSEPLAFRIEQLVAMIADNGIVLLHQVTIPRGHEIRVRIGKPLSSRDAKIGSEIPLTVIDDVFIDHNILVIGKGELAVGELDQVRPAGRFGRTGRLKMTIREVNSIDGTIIPVAFTDLAMNEIDKKKLGMAAGASAVGYLALGPVGLVGGIFVKGKEAELPKDSELILTATEDTRVNGVVINRH